MLDLAGGILARAAPGEVLVSHATERLLKKGFTTEELAPVQIPGAGEATAVHRIVQTDTTATRRETAPLIGREREMELLLGLWRQAVEGTVFQTFGVQPATEPDAGKQAGLSERELSILRALSDGLSNKQIAKQLWVAEQTVKFHLTNIYRKLGVSTRTEAVRHAYTHALLESPLLEHAESAA